MRPEKSPGPRELVMYTALSADGFIARDDGSVDWLEDPGFQIPGEDFGYRAFYESIDTTLMGYNTYSAILNFNIPFPYKDKTNYVATRRAAPEPNAHVQFIQTDLVAFVRELKSMHGRNIWLVGGGELNALFLRQGLVDRVILSVAPVFIGRGIGLLSGLEKDILLQLQHCERYPNGFIQMDYVPVYARRNGN